MTQRSESFFPKNEKSFVQLVDEISQSIDVDARLPQWPFRAARGNVDICEYTRALGGSFGSVIEALAVVFGDRHVSVVALEPTKEEFTEEGGSFPGFRVPTGNLFDWYYESLSFESSQVFASALTDVADTLAITGSSGSWAIWGQRRWEIALIQSPIVGGPWTTLDVPFFQVEEALDEFVEPFYEKPLADGDRELFLRNWEERTF